MGQEIKQTDCSADDLARFQQSLKEETAALGALADAGGFRDPQYRLGCELEAWLLDHACHPAPINEALLAELDDGRIVPELSRYNVELNTQSQSMRPGALDAMYADLEATWDKCQETAHGMDAALAMIGILPTLRTTDLNLASMSSQNRYALLNRQVLRARGGEPIRIRIEGTDALSLDAPDVMLEAATTSFQIHLQVPAAVAARHYNAGLIAAAPLLAVATNSPLLFGKRLWAETRIPLFEQSVALGGYAGLAEPAVRRVGFGQGYARASLVELFQENVALHPVLLPIPATEPADRFPHLRLHNGCIWRWVRPLIGFDAAGTPHWRIEHRVLPSGPSLLDMLANTAFCIGLSAGLAERETPPETLLPFVAARGNLYLAARNGLSARLTWLDGRQHAAADLVAEHLLPLAEHGLVSLGLPAEEIGRHLSVIAARIETGNTGAGWLLHRFDALGGDVYALMSEYLEQQRSGAPVHEWPC